MGIVPFFAPVSFLPLLYFFSLLHVSVEAQAYRNITLGSTLSSLDDKSAWISPSGEFSFGFSIVGSNLYVGIRYEKIPGKPLVWTANRDKPAPHGSTVELTNKGVLVIKDAANDVIFAIPSSSDGSDIRFAAMLDTGNLVLQSSPGSEFKWQSFDTPTDTILPTQNLALDYNLYAALLPTNLSKGRFYTKMQSDGNFVGFGVEISQVTYVSNTYGTKGKLVFDESGSFYIFQWEKNETVQIAPLDQIPKPSKDFFFRATIDYDGIFRLYSYPKNTNGSWPASWNVIWATHKHACDVAGICGSNGYCNYEPDNAFYCACPRGFSYVDANYTFFGCQQDPQMHDCGRHAAGYYVIEALDNVDWDGDYAVLSVDESTCRQSCLSDCSCTVAVYWDSKCFKKRLPLRNGGPSIENVKTLIKVPTANSSLLLPPPPQPTGEAGGPNMRCKDASKWSRWVGKSVLFVVSASLNLLFIVASIILCLRRRNPQRQEEHAVLAQPEMQLRSYSYKELEEATGGFKEKLGGGSFGTVYKGMVAAAHGPKLIAVKKLDKFVEDGEKEFKTEVRVIGRTHHKNLVQLLGFCDEGSHRLLVYEYMEQGSLSSFLFGSTRPDWNQRVQIAFGIARGLTYLHEECSSQIIHCDIKPGNILIDGNLTPKISDFGLAKLMKHDQTKTNTDIRGTKGYVAPEWFRKMAITVKVDVYSFGVMLLEIICCRKNVELNKMDEPSAILVDWAFDCFAEKQLDRLVEGDEDAINDMRRVKKMVMVALWCIQEEPSLRPTIKKVTQMLEGAVDVAVPPNPSSFISSMG